MHGTIKLAEEARQRAYATPLEQFDVAHPELFRTDTFWPYFDRLRKEEPVHYCKDSLFGPYWSVTKYNDIMSVDTNHGVFSSAAALGGITIRDVDPDLRRESFISMDQPRHSAQRKTVAPMFTPNRRKVLPGETVVPPVVVPSALSLCNSRVPLLTVTGPVKILVPCRIRIPAPVLVIPAAAAPLLICARMLSEPEPGTLNVRVTPPSESRP